MEYQQILIVTVKLLYKARRVPENIEVLRQLDYVRAAKSGLHSDVKSEYVIMTVMTCAAVMDENQAELIRLPSSEYIFKYQRVTDWLRR